MVKIEFSHYYNVHFPIRNNSSKVNLMGNSHPAAASIIENILRHSVIIIDSRQGLIVDKNTIHQSTYFPTKTAWLIAVK